MSLTTLLQRFGDTRVGGSAVRLGYQVMARVGARRILRLPAVEGVYLTGSATRWGQIRPGFSDLDLVAMVELSSLEHELELRRGLGAELRALAAVPALFKHVDYFERRDLDSMRRLGNGWCLDMDRTWRCLAGEDCLGSPAPVPPPKRRLESLIGALRRWQGSSSFLADPGNGRAPLLNAIGARRTLSDVLAAWLGVQRLQPLEPLLAALGARAAELPALRELVRDPGRLTANEAATVDACLVASLEALDAFAAEVGADYRAPWSALLSVDLPFAPPVAERDALAKVALASGFAAVAFAPDRYGRGLPFVVARPAMTASEALLALRRMLVRRGQERATWPRPVLLTPALWRAAAALDPAPFAGAALAQHAGLAAGDPGAAPGAPPAPSWDDLIAGRAVQMLNRPRGRGLRSGVLERSAAAKLAYEVRSVAPALASALRGEPAVLALRSGAAGEASLIAELRAWCDGVRPELLRRVQSSV